MRTDYLSDYSKDVETFNQQTADYRDSTVRTQIAHLKKLMEQLELELKRLEALDHGLSQLSAKEGQAVKPDGEAETSERPGVKEMIRTLNNGEEPEPPFNGGKAPAAQGSNNEAPKVAAKAQG